MVDAPVAVATLLAAASAATGVGLVVLTLASRRPVVRDGGGYEPEFSVVCTIRGDDGVVDRAEEVLALEGVEEVVVADDAPDSTEGVERLLGGDLRWYRRRNVTSASQRHVSLNIASERAENDVLVVMDVDTHDVTPDLARRYGGEAFAVGKVLPIPHENVFGLYEKVDNDVRQKVHQVGRYNLDLCPNLSGCFYLARRERLRSYGYSDAYEDFVLTLDLYENGDEVTHLGERVATQHIPNSLGELLERRVRWFSLFASNCPEILLRGATMPRFRHRLGILLYPFVWYFGAYAAFASLVVGFLGGSLLPGLVGGGALAAGVWTEAAVSQADETSLPRALSRATYYVAGYATLMLLLPPLAAGRYCGDVLTGALHPERS